MDMKGLDMLYGYTTKWSLDDWILICLVRVGIKFDI